MLSRRSIRIKVMQTIYSVDRGAASDFYAGESLLRRNLKQTVDLFYYQLLHIYSVAEFSHKYLEIIQSRHIKTEFDHQQHIKIAEHPFIVALGENKQFKSYIKDNNLKKNLDKGIIRELYKSLSDSEFYREYIEQTDSKLEEKIVSFIFKEIMLKNERYQAHLDENFTHFDEDSNSVRFRLIDLLEDMDAFKKGDVFDKLYDKSDADFAIDLLNHYRNYHEDYEVLIEPQLKNWDIQRIAKLDIILIKLALCELLNFESIPIKVSMNEYIDISKLYSTPKSHEFVNGVLDRLRKKLQNEKKINKSGRGLLS